MRISLPEQSREPDEGNALSPEELQKFRAMMRTTYPQHYPLLATPQNSPPSAAAISNTSVERDTG